MPPRRSRRNAGKSGPVATEDEPETAQNATNNLKQKGADTEKKVDAAISPEEAVPEKEEKDLRMIDKIRIENNRQRALQLRKQRKQEEEEIERKKGKMHKVSTIQEVDTGGGFFLEEGEEGADMGDVDFAQLMQDEPFVIAGSSSEVECGECCRPFALSFLKNKFSVDVCDACHDRERHKLVTRTTAKTKFLLKDADLDRREPILKFITKKNPRNNHWGEMKLYLQSQCYDRAMEIWGSMEAIEDESTKRKILSAKAKSKKYEKKMAELKREVRSSLYKVDLAGHTHEWGAESYNEDSDEYTKQCATCGHSMSYEKM